MALSLPLCVSHSTAGSAFFVGGVSVRPHVMFLLLAYMACMCVMPMPLSCSDPDWVAYPEQVYDLSCSLLAPLDVFKRSFG